MDVDRVIRRTWRYWYEDGLAEMASGVVFLAVGLLSLAQAMVGESSGALMAIALPVIVVGGTLLGSRVVAAAKVRLVYPRTGYVAYRKRPSSRRLAAGVAGGTMGIVISILLGAAPASRAWIPAVVGLLIGAMWLWSGYRFDLARFYVLAGLAALSGVLASVIGLGDVLGSAVFFGLQGLALIVSGAVALTAYLRQAERREEAEGCGC